MKRGDSKVCTYIIILWVLINMNAPAWTYVLLGIAAFIKILQAGIYLGKKKRGDSFE